MLSRVADSLYWMSRYLERAEHTTRLLDVNVVLYRLGGLTALAQRGWVPLVFAVGFVVLVVVAVLFWPRDR